MKADLFVLNYNGAEYIIACIASLLEAIKRSQHQCNLVVIDNKSSDHSVQTIRDEFPNISLMLMQENRVLCSFNKVVAQSNAELVFLLNNDLQAEPSFIDPLVSVFLDKKDAFIAAPKSYLLDHSFEGGRTVPFISFGFFGTTSRFRGYEKVAEMSGLTFAAGFGAFDRRKFLELRGFDELYLPGRMEDSDLAFRAWKKGWRSYYQPKSILYHIGGKSFKDRFGVRGTMELAHRNTFLFMWKNIDAPKYWFSHFFFLLPRMIWMLAKGHFELVTGFVKALGKLKQALIRRRGEKKINYRYSDQEVISFFGHGY